jgi:hypothetical protein
VHSVRERTINRCRPPESLELERQAAAFSHADPSYPRNMAKVLVTGMSGTGKSTALQILSEHGHRVVDTDTDEWSHWVTLPDGSSDWVWREDAIIELLANHKHGSLFVTGCKSNQGKFLPTVRPHCPAERTGRHPFRQDRCTKQQPVRQESGRTRPDPEHLAVIEPRLRTTATIEIDDQRRYPRSFSSSKSSSSLGRPPTTEAAQPQAASGTAVTRGSLQADLTEGARPRSTYTSSRAWRRLPSCVQHPHRASHVVRVRRRGARISGPGRRTPRAVPAGP